VIAQVSTLRLSAATAVVASDQKPMPDASSASVRRALSLVVFQDVVVIVTPLLVSCFMTDGKWLRSIVAGHARTRTSSTQPNNSARVLPADPPLRLFALDEK
jgi:hypothetical protein